MAIKKIKWVILVSALAQVGGAHAEDLLTVYQQALESDPNLKAAGLKVEIGSAQKGQALGQMLPQVSGGANWSANNTRSSSPAGINAFTKKAFPDSASTNNYHGDRYYLSVNQTLIDFGKFWTWRRAQETENQYIAENIEAEHTLLSNVVEKYFDVLAAEDQLFFYQNERQATEKKLEQIQKRYAKQLLKITDVYEMEANLDLIKANEIDAETALVKAKESLKELTNAEPVNLLKLREDIVYKPLEGSLEDWIAVAKSENPILAAQIRAIAAAGNDVAAQKAKNLPVVDMQFNYFDTNTGYQSAQINNTEVQVAAINVTVPIFSGGTAMHQVLESQHRLALAENENEAKVRALIKETSDAYLSANANVRRINASVKALESTTKSHEAMEKGFGYGVETITDVLIAQQNEFKAKRDLSQAKYNYIKNRIRFMHAIGMISVENLQEVNDWLQVPAKL